MFRNCRLAAILPSMSKRLVVVLSVLALLGAGCGGNKPAEQPSDPNPEFIPRQGVKAPGDSWAEYEKAEGAVGGARQGGVNPDLKRSISLEVPASWSAKSGVWRPTETDKLNLIRASYFPDAGPETEWSNQQKLPESTVVHAEKLNDRYILMLDHKGLKSSILKIFYPDPEHPGDGFFFMECRVAWDSDQRSDLWSACKGAVKSARFEIAGE